MTVLEQLVSGLDLASTPGAVGFFSWLSEMSSNLNQLKFNDNFGNKEPLNDTIYVATIENDCLNIQPVLITPSGADSRCIMGFFSKLTRTARF